MVSHKFLWRNTGIPSLSGIFFAKIPRLFVETLDFHRHLGSRRFAFCLGGIRAPAGLHAKKLLDGCQCLFAGQGRVDGATDEECCKVDVDAVVLEPQAALLKQPSVSRARQHNSARRRP